jgi:hypothetical protein
MNSFHSNLSSQPLLLVGEYSHVSSDVFLLSYQCLCLAPHDLVVGILGSLSPQTCQ